MARKEPGEVAQGCLVEKSTVHVPFPPHLGGGGRVTGSFLARPRLPDFQQRDHIVYPPVLSEGSTAPRTVQPKVHDPERPVLISFSLPNFLKVSVMG